MSEIDRERSVLSDRSNLYHGGRLEIDSLLDDYSSIRRSKIYQIKRELVKLRQIDKQKSK